MTTKRNTILIAVCLCITILLAIGITIAVTSGKPCQPNSPVDPIEQTETDAPTIPAIEPIETGDRQDDTDSPKADIEIDIQKENDKHTRPTEPTIEGEPYVGDDVKEDGNAE